MNSIANPVVDSPSFDLASDYGRSKLVSLAAAIKTHVKPQMALHVSWSDARPNAALLELVRQFHGTRPAFSVSCVGFANSQAALVAAGLVRRLVTAYAGESYPAGGINPLFKRAIDAGEVEIENWSQWTLVARLMAGAMGLPFMPTRSLAGSAMSTEHVGARYATVADPFSGKPTGVVAALIPDIAFVQGVAGDTNGNVLMAAPFGEGGWGAMAARHGVIACVERIVSTDEIRRSNQLVKIPAHVVRAVCEVPFGSHPYGSYSGITGDPANYVEDADFIAEAAAACRDPLAFAQWLDTWVYQLRDHREYLARLTPRRLEGLRAAAHPDHWRSEVAGIEASISTAPATAEEMMIVAASRRMVSAVRERCYQVLLAGIGASNLAGWLAEQTLTEGGVDIALMSEIGIYGYTPRPGEPFVFSNRNLGTARALTDVSMLLGTMVSGAHNRCLGALGAALIDRFGNIGSTYDNDGGFIVGSGGANDIASAASEVIVTVRHGASRLVESVKHVTSPGRAVLTIITTRAVLARQTADASFRLVSVLPAPGESLAQAIDAAVQGCGWTLETASDVSIEPAPSALELKRLRMYDPRRTFLGRLPGAEQATSARTNASTERNRT